MCVISSAALALQKARHLDQVLKNKLNVNCFRTSQLVNLTFTVDTVNEVIRYTLKIPTHYEQMPGPPINKSHHHANTQLHLAMAEEMGKASNSFLRAENILPLWSRPQLFCHSWPIFLIKHFLIYQVWREK